MLKRVVLKYIVKLEVAECPDAYHLTGHILKELSYCRNAKTHCVMQGNDTRSNRYINMHGTQHRLHVAELKAISHVFEQWPSISIQQNR
jgi:hypothetical protein